MTPAHLLEGLLHGTAPVRRRAMAKAITLLESTRADHRAQADELLTAMLPHTGQSFRLGISGVPGVGKSTFIEALGLFLIAQGHRVAVTARSGEGPAGSLTVRADVTDGASLDAAYAEVESKLGPVEVLVANAGITKDTLVMRMTDEEFEVVAIEEGQGNWAGVAKRVTCRLPDGRTFGAGIKGSRDRGIELLNETHHIVTIKYFQLTPDGIPRFGVATKFHGEKREF